VPSFKHETAPFIQEDIGEISMAKVMPQDLMAEQAIIGACILNPEIIPFVESLISADDFYSERHKELAQAIFVLRDKTDLVSLCHQLPGHKDYISSIAEAVSTSAGYKHHCEIIKELSNQREIIRICTLAQENIYNHENFDTTKQNIKESLISLEKGQNVTLEDNNKFYGRVYESIYRHKEPGIYTGLDCLQEHLYFEPGYIHAIAAESGVGKSALMLQIADNISREYTPCLFYSLESTRERLALRQIARHAKIALTRLNHGHFADTGQEEKLMQSVTELAESNLILIDDERYIEIEKLVSHAESYALQNKISAIFLDYLQLAQSSKRFNSDKQRIDNTIYCIKSLAKRLNIPIIYGCQLRKDVSGRPTLDHLYESNVIRQATDNIVFLYAPNYEPVEYEVELFMAKGKEQQRFSQWLHFNGNYQLFSEGEKPVSDKPQKKTWWQE
jgi:replicative DNA helicase